MSHARSVAALAAGLGLLAAAPAPALASSAILDTYLEATTGPVAKLLGRADTSCTPAGPSAPRFAAFKDSALYVDAPGGTFEPGAGPAWARSGSVTTVPENEPWRVSGRAADSTSVAIGPGGSITSAALCAGLQYPTLRMFTRAPKGQSAVALVTARYTGPDGVLAALPIGFVTASSSWAPSSLSLTGSGIPVFTGNNLSFRIAPISGTIQLDDVYVDPLRRS